MGITGGIVVFLLIWWLALFMVLPWGVRPPDAPETGHETGAPEKPRIKEKVLITTGIAMVAWLIIFAFIELNLFSFRDAVRDWWSSEGLIQGPVPRVAEDVAKRIGIAWV